MEKICGIAASPGISIGPLVLFDIKEDMVAAHPIDEQQVATELARFEDALIKTRKEILDIQHRITEGLGTEHAEIFNAHLLVVEDRTLIEEVIKRVRLEKRNLEAVFSDVLSRYVRIFSDMEDEYLRERVVDIKDVGRRIIANLTGQRRRDFATKTQAIIVAHDISPSDAASLNQKTCIGLVTEVGSKTSHTAIMARSMGIPAVVGLGPVIPRLEDNTLAILDGLKGMLIVQPDKETLAHYRQKQEDHRIRVIALRGVRDLPTQTKDGFRITLSANLELSSELPQIIASGAEGVGLYRTEYFYLNRIDLPDEEEQFREYRMVLERMAPNTVIIRTLDLGGDKFLSNLQIPHEMNPFLGWRAIRFCLARPDIFKVQLRAIMRASVYGKAKIMYPLISDVGELIAANSLLAHVKRELLAEGIPFDNAIEVGVMIEVPSAVVTADLIAEHARFFSIGTNDLIQYTLATDRVNEKVAHLYDPFHPAILRLLRRIITVGHQKGLWVGMCGEMAADPLAVLLLVGLGIDELSTNTVSIPPLKKLIRTISKDEASRILPAIYQAKSSIEVKETLFRFLREHAPEYDLADEFA